MTSLRPRVTSLAGETELEMGRRGTQDAIDGHRLLHTTGKSLTSTSEPAEVQICWLTEFKKETAKSQNMPLLRFSHHP